MSYKWNVFCELSWWISEQSWKDNGLAVNTASKTFVYTMPL